MAVTTKTNLSLIPDLVTKAVVHQMSGKDVFVGSSPVVKSGIVVVRPTFDGGPDAAAGRRVGDVITVPYWGTLGEAEDLTNDGDALTPAAIYDTHEHASVAHSGKAFSVTEWTQFASADDPYGECARQIEATFGRRANTALVTAAVASGGLVHDVYSASNPVNISRSLLLNAKQKWGDEQFDGPVLLCRSEVATDAANLTDSTGKPLLVEGADGRPDRIAGLPVVVSDHPSLLAGSTNTASATKTGTGTTTCTISGTPNGIYNLKILCTTGAQIDSGNARVKYSLDGGNTYSAILSVPTNGVVVLDDTEVDAIGTGATPSNAKAVTGVSATSGLTATFAPDSSKTLVTADYFTSAAIPKVTSLICASGCLALWYNAGAMGLQTDKNILTDARLAAIHMYYVVHRYRRAQGKTRPGLIKVVHNTLATG